MSDKTRRDLARPLTPSSPVRQPHSSPRSSQARLASKPVAGGAPSVASGKRLPVARASGQVVDAPRSRRGPPSITGFSGFYVNTTALRRWFKESGRTTVLAADTDWLGPLNPHAASQRAPVKTDIVAVLSSVNNEILTKFGVRRAFALSPMLDGTLVWTVEVKRMVWKERWEDEFSHATKQAHQARQALEELGLSATWAVQSTYK